MIIFKHDRPLEDWKSFLRHRPAHNYVKYTNCRKVFKAFQFLKFFDNRPRHAQQFPKFKIQVCKEMEVQVEC